MSVVIVVTAIHPIARAGHVRQVQVYVSFVPTTQLHQTFLVDLLSHHCSLCSSLLTPSAGSKRCAGTDTAASLAAPLSKLSSIAASTQCAVAVTGTALEWLQHVESRSVTLQVCTVGCLKAVICAMASSKVHLMYACTHGTDFRPDCCRINRVKSQWQC
jgi:hypothetical protein